MLFCPEVFTPADADQRHLFQVPVTIWNCIFRTQFLRNNDIHFRSSVTYEDDWVFVGTVLSYCSCLVVTPKAYYSWTINPQSRSHTSVFIPNYFSKRSQHRELMLTTAARSGGGKKGIRSFCSYFRCTNHCLWRSKCTFAAVKKLSERDKSFFCIWKFVELS